MGGVSGGGWDYYLAGGYENEDGWREATGAENLNGFLNLGRRGPDRGLSLQALAPNLGPRPRAHCRRASSARLRGPTLPLVLRGPEPASGLALRVFPPRQQQPGIVHRLRSPNSGRALQRQPGTRQQRSQLYPQPDPGWEPGLALDHPKAQRQLLAPARCRRWANQVHIELLEETPTTPSTSTLTTDVESPSYDIAGYALADLKIDRVTFSGGLRFDYIHIPFEDRLDPSADTTNSFKRLSPRGA